MGRQTKPCSLRIRVVYSKPRQGAGPSWIMQCLQLDSAPILMVPSTGESRIRGGQLGETKATSSLSGQARWVREHVASHRLRLMLRSAYRVQRQQHLSDPTDRAACVKQE